MAKSKLTKKQVEHIAKLANLKLSSGEVQKFSSQLSAILDFVEILNQVPTDGVDPVSQVTGLENIFIQDKPGDCLTQDQALSGTSNKENGYFRASSVFEK